MVGLTDPRFLLKTGAKTDLWSSTISHFSNGRSLLSFPLLSLRRSFRFSEETVIEKYSLCPSLTVKFYWTFAALLAGILAIRLGIELYA
jgi:hypothetical protein